MLLTLVVDSIDRHLATADSIESAAVIPGFFIAWCVNMGLVNPAEFVNVEASVVRLKYREITGGEFLVAALGGELHEEHLSERGLFLPGVGMRLFSKKQMFGLAKSPTRSGRHTSRWHLGLRSGYWVERRGPRKWWRFWR
ncbi:MAG: hypothetical protein CM1200mP9_01660 [Gammaproteobacteria bacterium]|nr:MAG: hypothetical protein CM1200mP9_01660 [Gammaproteobacteria bacterium]